MQRRELRRLLTSDDEEAVEWRRHAPADEWANALLRWRRGRSFVRLLPREKNEMSKTKATKADKAVELQGDARAILDDVSGLVDQLEERASQLDEIAGEHDRTLVPLRGDGEDVYRVQEGRICDARDILRRFANVWRRYYRQTTEHGYL